ncbi:MAG: hypothetical protein ACD_23C00649G0001 [uncultured bacterium]|nr:MAG: hypothetical protein ACD_23C00649G0001 [uncultured bacterium]
MRIQPTPPPKQHWFSTILKKWRLANRSANKVKPRRFVHGLVPECAEQA